jgi:hypothetical protein
MRDSIRDASPVIFQGASHIHTSNAVFNQVGGSQYNINMDALSDEMVVCPAFIESIHWLFSFQVVT